MSRHMPLTEGTQIPLHAKMDAELGIRLPGIKVPLRLKYEPCFISSSILCLLINFEHVAHLKFFIPKAFVISLH